MKIVMRRIRTAQEAMALNKAEKRWGYVEQAGLGVLLSFGFLAASALGVVVMRRYGFFIALCASALLVGVILYFADRVTRYRYDLYFNKSAQNNQREPKLEIIDDKKKKEKKWWQI